MNEMNANAYKNRKGAGTGTGTEEMIKMGIKVLPILFLMAVVLAGVLFVYNYYPRQEEVAPHHSFLISSSELIKETTVAEDFFVLEYIPEQKVVITGLLKPGYGKVNLVNNGKEISYSFNKNTNGLILPPPEEWQSLKVTGYW